MATSGIDELTAEQTEFEQRRRLKSTSKRDSTVRVGKLRPSIAVCGARESIMMETERAKYEMSVEEPRMQLEFDETTMMAEPQALPIQLDDETGPAGVLPEPNAIQRELIKFIRQKKAVRQKPFLQHFIREKREPFAKQAIFASRAFYNTLSIYAFVACSSSVFAKFRWLL